MDPDKVQGDIQRPYQQEPEQSDKIDPEKFKRVMKIEDTDEAQKRNKRNLKKEEEEGEDEEVEEKAPPPANAGAFAEFMSDKDDLDNVMNAESGGVRYQAQPEDESIIAPEPGSINTEGVEVDEEEPTPSSPPSQQQPESQTPQQGGQQQPPSTPSQQPAPQEATGQTEKSFSPPLYEEDIQQQPYNNQPLNQQQQPQQSQQPQSEETEEAQQPQKGEQKEKGEDKPKEGKKAEDESLLASQPKMSDILPKKKKSRKRPGPEVRTMPKEMMTPEGERKAPEGEGVGKPTEAKETPMGETFTRKEEGVPTKGPFEGIEGEEVPAGMEKGMPLGKDVPSEEMTTGVEGGAPKQKGIQEGEHTPFKRLSPQEIRNQRLGKAGEATTAALEGMVVPSMGEGQKGEMGKDKKDDDDSVFIEASAESASITLPLFDAPIAAATPTEETPSYARLTPEVHELFEKMGGVMLVQMDKGVTTTTMDINMPNSVFNGAQVILEQYDIAPHSYNLQLVGSPEAVKAFNEHLGSLDNAFKDARFNFEVNILNPSISQTKKPPHLIRRKGASGDKGGTNDNKQNK